MTPKVTAIIEAIRAISHQFVQRQTAIRWLEWLQRKLSNVSAGFCILKASQFVQPTYF
jgi:hypothetical protein